jgi:hypothetical protein
MAVRLDAGRSVAGTTLPRKVIPNGRPLGYGESVTGVPGRLRRGAVRVFLAGFDVVYPEGKVGWFHRGRPGRQVPRPIVGLTAAQARRWAGELRAEVARQLTAQLRRGGR